MREDHLETSYGAMLSVYIIQKAIWTRVAYFSKICHRRTSGMAL